MLGPIVDQVVDPGMESQFDQRFGSSSGQQSEMKIIYNEPWYKAQIRYQEAVKRAGFLSNEEKVNWFILGGSLTLKELQEAEKVIINEDLRRLKVRGELEKIKPIIS